jgi:DNA polymerase III subunit epsilon
MTTLIFDTETTGLLLPSDAALDSQPRIIEIGLIRIAGKKRAEFSWLINPGIPITEEITKITGLRDADVAGAPTFSEVVGELVEAFLGAEQLVAHNLPFDRGMLVTELRRLGREHAFPYPPRQLCTVAAFEHVKGRRMRLTELYEHALKRPLAQTHRALDDARALEEVLGVMGGVGL